MTNEEFNKKWFKYLEHRQYGLDIENETITNYLDSKFTELKESHPDFTYSQIKLKFGFPRVYIDHVEYEVTSNIEKEIYKLLQLKKGEKVTYSDGYKTEKGIVKEIKPDGRKMFVVYHCGDDWDHYEDYTSALTDLSMINVGW